MKIAIEKYPFIFNKKIGPYIFLERISKQFKNKNINLTNKFDPFYDLLGDFDLWIKLSLITDFTCVPNILEKSRNHSANLSLTKKKKWLKERRYFYRKFFKELMILNFPKIMVYIFKTEIKGILNVK